MKLEAWNPAAFVLHNAHATLQEQYITLLQFPNRIEQGL
jgi:hypothetical protein